MPTAIPSIAKARTTSNSDRPVRVDLSDFWKWIVILETFSGRAFRPSVTESLAYCISVLLLLLRYGGNVFDFGSAR